MGLASGRADVMVWSPSGARAAIELQHNSIGLEEIERRAFSYAREGIAQTWVPFIKVSLWSDAEVRGGGDSGDRFVKKYSAKPFERWAHGLHNGRLWFWDPADKVLWQSHLTGHQIWVEESSWYEEGGEEAYAGGYHRWSRRWRELTLWGPYDLKQVRIKIERRKAWRTDRYNWPAGQLARLVLDGH